MYKHTYVQKKLFKDKVVQVYKNSFNINTTNNNSVMREILPENVSPLTHLVNRYLCEGFFPVPLKIARVVPVYKKGSRDLPSR